MASSSFTLDDLYDANHIQSHYFLFRFYYFLFSFIIVGGVSRGIVEGPFEYIKVRRQVEQPWKFTEIFNGSGATIFRNSFLFSGFVIYMDLLKQIVPGGLSPFWTGNFTFLNFCKIFVVSF